MTNANSSGQHVIERIPHLLWGDVDTHTDDLMVVSALRLCLDKIGPKCSKAYIAGTCGAAFDIGWARGTLDAGADGAIFAHPGHFEPGIANLFKAVGWQHTVAYRSEPEKLWDVAVASLVKDRPVVAVEWESNHFVVLTAYDTTERCFFGRRYEFKDEASQDYVPIPPETLSHVIGIGKPIQPLSPRDAALGALRVAVANARTGTDTDATGRRGSGDPMIYGPRAYEEHARLIPDDLDPELPVYEEREHFLLWRFDALNLARVYAIHYLRDIAGLFDDAARGHLESAVEAYRSFLGMLASENMLGPAGPTSEAWERVYFGIRNQTDLLWDGGRKAKTIRDTLASREGRERFAVWLVRLRDEEETVLASLAAAVAAAGL